MALGFSEQGLSYSDTFCSEKSRGESWRKGWSLQRRRLRVTGTVQGVGFRPFVHRLARRSGLTGAVGNDGRGVWCEVQGPEAALDAFTNALRRQAPPLARIREIETEKIAVIGDENDFVIAGLRGLADPQVRIAVIADEDDFVIAVDAWAAADLEASAGARPAADPRGGVAPMTPASIPPDAAVCEACSDEISDPADRRFGYAFTCCTDCGPRYTVVHSLPYDRTGTSMADFPLCGQCQAEYDRAGDRRHHAQATCCPECGPTLGLRTGDGRLVAGDIQREPSADQFNEIRGVDGRLISGDPADRVASLIAGGRGPHQEQSETGDPIAAAALMIAAGRIVAVKGLGGYQLVCRADDDTAVARLRAAKNRYEKPFALLVADLAEVETLVELDDLSRRALTGPERPIVLAERRPGARVCEAVAPGSSRLGVMLPAAPLHQLLASASAAPAPLVCTSGNRSDEPIAIDDADAADRLGSIADAFLAHDRRIERRADDSVGQVAAGRFQLLRRARGFVPRPVRLQRGGPAVLGVGAEMKNTVCLGLDDEAHLSVHLGDLEDHLALEAFEGAVADLLELSGAELALVVHDRHPEYLSAKFARSQTLAPAVGVQHHHAHLAACLADNACEGPAIGVIFDGLGWGDDDTLWGGEFLVGDAAGFDRAAHLTPVPLPGGTAAIREPWRMAVAHLVRLAGSGADASDSSGGEAHAPADGVGAGGSGADASDSSGGWSGRAGGADTADRSGLLGGLEAEAAAAARLLGRSKAEAAAVAGLCAGGRSLVTSSMGRLFDAVAALCGLADSVSYDGQAAVRLEQAAAVTGRSYRWDLPDSGPSGRGPRSGLALLPSGPDPSDPRPHGPPMRIDPAPVIAAVAADAMAGVDPAVIAGAFHTGLAHMIVEVCARLRDATGVGTAALSGGVFQNRLLVELTAPLLETAGFEVLLHSQVPPNDGGISLGQVAVGRALLRTSGSIDGVVAGDRR